MNKLVREEENQKKINKEEGTKNRRKVKDGMKDR